MIDFGAVGLTGEDPAGTAKPFPFPAATGGLNKRDALAKMPNTDANILTNMFPRPNWVELRRGYESYATGMSGNIETLIPYGGNTTLKFFACNGTSIYDISSSGAVGAAVVTGLTNVRFQWTNFTTAGGQFIIACNGADSVYSYNGSVWANPAITGVTSADLIYVSPWKNRLWFVEKNSTNAWYLPVNSIAGAATRLDLGPQFRNGGRLVWIGNLSYDTSDGPDDLIAFGSSLGEVVIYQGTDPSSATTFSISEHFVMGAPIGDRPVLKVGGDLAIITLDGVVSAIASSNKERSVQITQAAITNKIQTLFNQLAYSYSGNYGWQGQIYPRGSYVTFNIPISSTQFNQLVMNTQTGAWCQFENMNGICWGLYNDDLYFGSTNGIVYKADTTRQDNGGIISFDYQSAWSNFGSDGNIKVFQEGVTLIQSNGSPSILQSMNVDFQTTEPTGTLNPTTPPTSTWDAGLWDSAMWGGENSYYQWFSIGNQGTWGALRLKGACSGISLQINAYTITAEVGGAH